ncbi:MAG TPA: hypothetical protein H9946_01110 [Candidatus Jeotgalibaca pullicola]|nr:hypothetical protein [Candidatus Jeotgalibaca pullicola]
MKNVLKFLLLGVFLFSMPMMSKAEERNGSAEEVLNTYFKAIIENDVHVIVNNVNDERFNSLDQQISEYQTMVFRDKVLNYEILSDRVTSSNEIKFLVKVEYATGEISQVPILLTNDDETWKVKISLDSLDSEDFKTLKEAPLEPTTPLNSLSNQIYHMLCDWNFSGRGNSEFYSNCTFDINTSSAQVTIGGTQENTNGLSTVGISYSIVKKGLFGDDTWGGTYFRGEFKPNNQFSGTITGKSTSFKGAKIKFVPDYHVQNPGYSGVGGVW